MSNNLDSYLSYPCPDGHYCINGTQWSTQYPCPAGTYSPNTQLEDVSQCIQCDSGKYCATTGQNNYTGQSCFPCLSPAPTPPPPPCLHPLHLHLLVSG